MSHPSTSLSNSARVVAREGEKKRPTGAEQERTDAGLWHRAAVAAIRSNIVSLLKAGLRDAVERVTWAKKPSAILREYREFRAADPDGTAALVAEQRELERQQRLALVGSFGLLLFREGGAR